MDVVIVEGGAEEEVFMDGDMDEVGELHQCCLETKEVRKLHLYLMSYCIVYWL